MKEMLLEFLKKTGRKSEFKMFLDLFHDIPKKQFALIKISGETLEYHLESFAEDIAFLNKLGLYPLIVHGGGSKLNKELKNSRKIEGIRITPAEDMKVVGEIFSDISNSLKQKIIEKGGKAEIIENCIQADYLDRDKFGNVGKITNVSISKIEAAVRNNASPIISPLGIHQFEEDILLNINADTVAKELVSKIEAQKLIFVTKTGGVLNVQGEVIPFINLLSNDDIDFITGGMLVKVKEIGNFLRYNTNTEVVITSSSELLKEIFTIKGSGTFFRNYSIKFSKDLSELNLKELRNLLENSFGKELSPTYPDELITEVIWQKDYEAVALISQINGIPYLSKFAVADYRQGTGLGKAIWKELVARYPRLVWRSQANNKANEFYLARCSGMLKKGKWHLFWLNLKDEEIMPTMDLVFKKRESFLKEQSE